MSIELHDRINRIKTTALMKARKYMGPVELVNWWTGFKKNTNRAERFDELDERIQAQIIEWESEPYKIIGS
ncbi:MAG: hypothetical protein MI892_09520 [Desulfobacterales bacterium]|nr:hypothetical protein [Desulfobacterales bacterium]